MAENEQNTTQNVEDMDVIKQLMDIMGQQGMKEQAQCRKADCRERHKGSI